VWRPIDVHKQLNASQFDLRDKLRHWWPAELFSIDLTDLTRALQLIADKSLSIRVETTKIIESGSPDRCTLCGRHKLQPNGIILNLESMPVRLNIYAQHRNVHRDNWRCCVRCRNSFDVDVSVDGRTVIALSGAKGAGMGLYVTMRVNESEIITEYGPRIALHEAKQLPPHEQTRLFRPTRSSWVINGKYADTDKYRGAMINMASSIDKANVKFRERNKPHSDRRRDVAFEPCDYAKVDIVATKVIEAGQELFLNYGNAMIKRSAILKLVDRRHQNKGRHVIVNSPARR